MFPCTGESYIDGGLVSSVSRARDFNTAFVDSRVSAAILGIALSGFFISPLILR